MTPLRAVNLLAAVVGTGAALLISEPDVFAVMLGCGLVLVIVGAGSIAADAFPFHRLAFVCSLLTVPTGLAVGLSGFVSVPPLVVCLAAVALQVAPAAGKLRT